MPETVAKKGVCSKCGAEVRDGTVFCYACGGRVAPDETSQPSNGFANVVDPKAQAALDDLAQKLRGEEKATEPEDKLAKAAEERKKARVTQRKTREFVWEPRNDTPLTFIITVGVVVIVAVLVVLITVVWK
jgi:hypothetical protein